MRAILFGAIILGSLLIVYVRCDDVEKPEKRGRRPSCSRHSDCPGNLYCEKRYGSCYKLPQCKRWGWWGRPKCPKDTSCNRKLWYCVREDIQYCRKGSDCDVSTECCSRNWWGPRLAYCKKVELIGEGKKCCPRNPCQKCSPGLECKTPSRQSYYGKCQMIPTTAPPTTEPGSGEVDESLVTIE